MIQKLKYLAAWPFAFGALWVLLLSVWFVQGREAAMDVLDRI